MTMGEIISNYGSYISLAKDVAEIVAVVGIKGSVWICRRARKVNRRRVG